MLSDRLMTVRDQLAGRGAVIVSAGVLLIAAVLCLILLLVLRRESAKHFYFIHVLLFCFGEIVEIL